MSNEHGSRLFERTRRIAVLDAQVPHADGRRIAVATGSYHVTNVQR